MDGTAANASEVPPPTEQKSSQIANPAVTTQAPVAGTERVAPPVAGVPPVADDVPIPPSTAAADVPTAGGERPVAGAAAPAADADAAAEATAQPRAVPPAAEPNRVLFFAKVSPTAAAEEVGRLFAPYGAVESVNLFRAWATARSSKGCGLVTMTTLEAAEAAREALNGRHTWEGADAPIVVEYCCPSKLGAKAASAAAAKASVAAERAAAATAPAGAASSGAPASPPAGGGAGPAGAGGAAGRKRGGLKPSASFSGGLAGGAAALPGAGGGHLAGSAATLRYLALANRVALAGHRLDSPYGTSLPQLPQRSASFPFVAAAAGDAAPAGAAGMGPSSGPRLHPLLGSPLVADASPYHLPAGMNGLLVQQHVCSTAAAALACPSAPPYTSPALAPLGYMHLANDGLFKTDFSPGGFMTTGLQPGIGNVFAELSGGPPGLSAAPAALPAHHLASTPLPVSAGAPQLPSSSGGVAGRLPGNSAVDGPFVNMPAASSLIASQFLADRPLASSGVDSWGVDSRAASLPDINAFGCGWSPGGSVADSTAQPSPPPSTGAPSPPLRPAPAPPLPAGAGHPALYAPATASAAAEQRGAAAAAVQQAATQLSLQLTSLQAGTLAAHVAPLAAITGCAIALRPASPPPHAGGGAGFELVATGTQPQLQNAGLVLSQLLAFANT